MNSKYFLAYFLLLQLLFLKILAFFPEMVERFYSNQLYFYISKILRICFDPLPFSVGDCLYGLLLFFILKWFWKKRKSWKQQWKNNLLSIINFLSIFYFVFHLLWGFNYYREPLFEKMNIKKDYSEADLLVFTKKIIVKTNRIHKQITKNKDQKIVFPYSQKAVFENNLQGYKNLAAQHSFFEFKQISSKKSIISLGLTYMGFGGYLNPFTNEAQVNSLVPMYNFPTISCHEMAHQLGYASESECNFIGFLASVKNKNLYTQYSGYSFALSYCLRNIHLKDEETFKKLLKTINPGIIANYKESEVFWDSYQTPIEVAFHIFYDHFLKANQQKDGMEGYSKFLNLLINYSHKNGDFLNN